MKPQQIKKILYRNIRLYLVCGLFFLLFLVLIGRLYDLQVKKFNFYFAKASLLSQNKDDRPIRGTIFVKKGEELIPVAINKYFFRVYIVPKEIKRQSEVINFLSASLNVEPSLIEEKIGKKNDPYEVIAQKISEDIALKIKNQKFEGVYLESEPLRYYPFGNFLSHIIGFTSVDSDNRYVGRYGVEAYYDKELSDGNDLILAIDQNIQFQIEKMLADLVKKWKAEAGLIAVEDPKTGKILAAAGFPDFNPNEFNNFALENFLNPFSEMVYEPGSVFKAITMAGALNAGAITPETTYVDAGRLVINGRVIENWDFQEKGAHGKQTMTQVLENSLNTGAIFAENKLGHDLFAQYVRDFGFGQKTGIDLPGEITGNIKNLKGIRDINFATASFGQGISVVPVALLNAISAIANQGNLMKPYIVEKITNAAGDVNKYSPQFVRKVIRPETADTLTSMMTKAVESGKIAVIKGYDIVGKTGTAQIPNFGGKGYGQEFIHSYTGFAPAWDPQFAIIIKLDKPQGAKLSGMTVVPVFRDLTQFLLNYYNIPPEKQSGKMP